MDFTSLKGCSVCQGPSVISAVLLTFVVLPLRVQPSQRIPPPLRIQLYIPDKVPLHGLLLQQAPPCLLLPNGWWAALCIPTGIFTPLSWVQSSCFRVQKSTIAVGCVKKHFQGQHSMIRPGSNTEKRSGRILALVINSLLRFLTFYSCNLFVTACVSVCVSLFIPPECTIDRHMIFSVPASLTDPPLSTALLVAAGNSTCRPQRVTPEYALFKIPMDGCGTRRVVRFINHVEYTEEWGGY